MKEHDNYLSNIGEKFNEISSIAEDARSKGFDPSFKPETAVTVDLAERVEKSVGPPGVAARIRELSQVMPREELAFKLAEECVYGKFGSLGENSAEQAIRTALAMLDEGVTAAPIQGISSVRIKTNHDRTKYLAIYFAGPIRSAGGTEMALILVVADLVQHLLGLDRYKATEAEAKRFVEEVRLYEREVGRFQYKVSDTELSNAIMNLPIEVNGVETDPFEVAAFRNLPRIETNRVRGGALRVVNDGLIGRTQKVLKIVEKLGINGWNWLRGIRPQSLEREEAREFMYMEDVIGGRPIFSFPGESGGFRLRYGRCRNTGLSALGVHPATMRVLRNFIATGTQLRIEKPGKGGVIMPVESIEPPVVKLKDGSVLRVESVQLTEKISDLVESILFVGDLLIAFGEFLENNRPLIPSAFVEEWWAELLKVSVRTLNNVKGFAPKLMLSEGRIESFISDPLGTRPTPVEALELSLKLGVPLHPRYTYFWDNLTFDEFTYLRQALGNANVNRKGDYAFRIDLEADSELKRILEKLLVPHIIIDGKISIEEDAPILDACLRPNGGKETHEPSISILEAIRKISGIEIHRKYTSFIGARMGRPEKAKRREMKPVVHCLFPVGLAGGAQRNIVEAAKKSPVISVEVVRNRCPSCKEVTYDKVCSTCKEKTSVEYFCRICGRTVQKGTCPACKTQAVCFEQRLIDSKKLLEYACKRVGVAKPPEVVKGVKGLTSGMKIPERIEKGILRAKYDLSVFKDGTTRFDATNAPLTHFKALEVGVAVQKLKQLGYEYAWDGSDLTEANQLCSLRIQDIVIPRQSAQYFVRVASFVDEVLQRLYELPAYYNVKSEEDLVGHLVVGLSPHTSVGVIGRIVGFTEANVCFAHPFWHAAKRRDCDGDEDSLALALDVLLNFSKAFLPSKIGGLMDAPLLLTLRVNPLEVEDMVYNMETQENLPLAFFEEASQGSDPRNLSDIVETVFHRLGSETQFESFGFTHLVSNINGGNHENAYKKFSSMLEKVKEQIDLAETIRAVKAGEVAKKVLSTHLMRDLSGNLKAFSSQKLRCAKCNAKFRRAPLMGVCPKCGGKISLTVYRGSIEKYLEVARDLVRRYGIGKYYEQRLHLIQEEISSLFHVAEEKKQHVLGEFL